jgi:hypothetical protein
MPHERREHLLAEIDGRLTTLGMASHGQWDVPVFLYRDQTRLVAALDVLERPGLVERAQGSQMVRCSQVTEPSDPQRGGAWASQRACRVRLATPARGGDHTRQARRQAIQPCVQATWPRGPSRRGGHDPWRQAI